MIADKHAINRVRVTRQVLTFAALVLLPSLALSKRSEPAKVDPVIHEGIRYIVPNDDGRRGYIEAWEIQTNKKQWELTVFTNRLDPKLEEDVQWVFIKSLSQQDGMLVVTSERGKTYQVDLKTKAIIQSDLTQSRPSNVATQRHDMPGVVQKAITNGPLGNKYEVAFHMNPFFLSGDFNGDGKTDVAVLVKQRSTGKLGIAIIHGATDKVQILGAGVSIGNGGDDFEWMDTWDVRSKNDLVTSASAPKFHGDALLVGKSEAASALIYWNGKRYVWLQQGD
jgi:hypothetical protein